MIYTTAKSTIAIHDFFAQIKKTITYLMVASAITSVAYLFYWFMAVNNPIYLEQGEAIFGVLTKMLFQENGISAYLKTSVAMVGLEIPLLIFYFIVDSLEHQIAKNNEKKLEMKRQKARQKEYLKSLKQYDDIKYWSICLSLDYESQREISLSDKMVLSKTIFPKIQCALEKVNNEIRVTNNGVLIITSSNFDKYDMTYDTLLKLLSKIKTAYDNKYSLNMIPTITTDAFDYQIDMSEIKKRHYNIQEFNFKNRSCTTALFAKKYKHINRSKYMGIPVGSYIMPDSSNSTSYELNVVHKNLINTLASLS